jgi:N-acyl-D-aspartate/D-glutamate deacylase
MVQQREDLLEYGLGVNVAQLVPHGSVREAVLGMDDRVPSEAELSRMRDIVRDAMETGAFGMSSGLYSAPGNFSSIQEVIELAKVVARYDGIYASHVRDEADYNIGVVAAVEEVIRVSREARLPGVVTHIKVLGPRVWGFSQAIVHRIERARAEGVEVFADQYPYTASATTLAAMLIPRWAQVGGNEALIARLDSVGTRDRLRNDILENLDRRGGAGRLQFQRYPPDPSVEGRTLQAIAEQRGMHPADLTMALLRAGEASMVSFNMNDADVATFMRQSWTMTSSDGNVTPMNEGVPHPRWYGTFPRKIRKYVIEDGVVGLEHAIRSMTSLSAAVMRLEGRGVIAPGMVADVVVFDLERIRDKATFAEPHQLCEGMEYVLVNGSLAIDSGEFSDLLSGRVLTRRHE